MESFQLLLEQESLLEMFPLTPVPFLFPQSARAILFTSQITSLNHNKTTIHSSFFVSQSISWLQSALRIYTSVFSR